MFYFPFFIFTAFVGVLLNGVYCTKLPLQLCCTGGQNLTGLMYDYSDHFTDLLQQPEKEMCSSLRKDVDKLISAIKNAEGCPCNLAEKIEKELEDVEDDCAHSLSFIRALFDIVAMTTEHLDESWNKETAEFKEQIDAIDSLGIEEIKPLQFEANAQLKTHPRVGRKRMMHRGGGGEQGVQEH